MPKHLPNKSAWLRTAGAIAVLAVGLAAIGCSSATKSPPELSIELFGWNAQDEEFVEQLRNYSPSVQKLEVQLTQPESGRVVTDESFDVARGAGELPKLTFGDGLRLEFALLDGTGTRLASGGTPTFDISPNASGRSFQVMMVPYRGFAPVGGLFENRQTGERRYDEIFFDQRANSGRDAGRVGHGVGKTGAGRAVLVGGAQVAGGRPPGQPPTIEKAFDDVQRFDVNTGYATDLAVADKGDSLSVPRAYHTVTPLGGQLFAVIGGYTRENGKTVPTKSIEFVDLGRPAGSRVFRASNQNGNALALNTARAHHTATYLPKSDQIVVTGGQGKNANILNGIEVVDLGRNVVEKVGTLSSPRAEHAAVFMDHPKALIWIIGGRGPSGAQPTTERLTRANGGFVTEQNPSLNMTPGRFDMGVTRLDLGQGARVAVCGGYTTLTGEGTPLQKCEIGHVEQGWAGSWQMKNARGGAALYQMERSKGLVVLGGTSAAGDPVGSALRMSFKGTGGSGAPFAAAGETDAMYEPRFATSSVMMDNGMILTTGGIGPSEGSLTESADLTYYNAGDVGAPKK